MPETTDTTGRAAAEQPDRLELTRARFEELAAAATRLRTEGRPALARQLQRAALFLDPKAASDAVAVGRYDLDALDRQLAELEAQLQHAVVITPPLDPTDVVLGAAVRIRYEDGAEETLTLVGPTEGGETRGAVASTSALGKALLKKRPGETVKADGPDGQSMTVQIVSVRAARAERVGAE